jgi:ADP-heptose:LPS heptosyltransferase
MHHAAFGFTQKPDVMCDVEDLSVFGSQSMDFVYSSHTLEHISDYKSALKEWWRVVKVRGYLILYLPHKDFYPNMGQNGSNPDHKHDFLPQDIISAMEELSGWDLLECQERNEDQEYSMLLIFQKTGASRHRYTCREPVPEKTACVVRYGAYGDLMQASSVLAGLKKQGYHVTLFTSNPGAQVIEHDPHIDKIVLFDRDQVPNADLVSFWSWQKKKFTKFVNLSESVEGSLLAMPGRTLHYFPPAARHSLMNFNYLELQHELAGVPHSPEIVFYATGEERSWAEKARQKCGVGPVVLWALAGSSVHKTWPFIDNVLASILLKYPTARVVLTGNEACQILEQGWENEPRIIKTSGKWTIRQTLSFLPECDLIVGPETGVLNAAACMSVPKVVILSHSTQENLTRDWKNTVSLYAKNTVCAGRGDNEAPACHMMHYDWSACTQTPDGVAQCQADISATDVWLEVEKILDRTLK